MREGDLQERGASRWRHRQTTTQICFVNATRSLQSPISLSHDHLRIDLGNHNYYTAVMLHEVAVGASVFSFLLALAGALAASLDAIDGKRESKLSSWPRGVWWSCHAG